MEQDDPWGRAASKAGIETDEAENWIAIYSVPDQLSEAKAWRSKGLGPSQARPLREWLLGSAAGTETLDDSVVHALASWGVGRTADKPWIQAGIGPEECECWQRVGIDVPTTALRLAAIDYSSESFERALSSHDPIAQRRLSSAGPEVRELLRLAQAGVHPRDVVSWRAAGFSANAIVEWGEKAITLERALKLIDLGLDSSTAISFSRSCEPEDVIKLIDLGFVEDDAEWLADTGTSVDEIVEWSAAGFAPAAIREWQPTGFSIKKSDAWRRVKTTPAEAVEWSRCFFTPQTAKTWRQAKIAPSDARLWSKAGIEPLVAKRRISAGLRPPTK